MRFVGLVLILLTALVSAHEVTIIFKNFEGYAQLKIYNKTELIFDAPISSGAIFELPADSYIFEVSAMNKTFLKELEVNSDQILEFNLAFTNSTDVLSITIHSLVLQDRVEEVIIVSNSADLNFEGDLTIPMPEFRNLQILSSNLDFIEAILFNGSLVFRSLLVAERSSGNILISYNLVSNVMKRDLRNERIMLISLVEVEDYENLTKTFKEMGGQKVTVFEGNGSFSIRFRFNTQIQIFYIIILIISISAFLIFFTKRTRWEDEG
ncbi:MAG: hypothetical protein QXR27_01370 [Archaeoglobaceae archaeon]